jgi:hypothetical protein
MIDQASQIAALQRQIVDLHSPEMLEVRLPYAQRVLNPFPAASSGAAHGDYPQSTAMQIVRWNISVLVQTTNNATNYWTLTLVNAAGTTLATLDTSAASAATWTRLTTTTITQPASSNVVLAIIATKTLNPGGIFIVPELLIFP